MALRFKMVTRFLKAVTTMLRLLQQVDQQHLERPIGDVIIHAIVINNKPCGRLRTLRNPKDEFD